MSISNLPNPGNKFRVSQGPTSFSRHLDKITRHGKLSNLKDNKASIIKAISTHEQAIKVGKFDRGRRLQAWRQIKKADPNLSAKDSKDIKKILSHLGKTVSASETDIKIDKALDKSTQVDGKKEQARASIERFRQSQYGGDAALRSSFIGAGQEEDKGSVSADIMRRRYLTKEDKLKARMPRQRVKYDEEREKRLEVTTLRKDWNKRFDPKAKAKAEAEAKKKDKQILFDPFQNL